MNDKINKINLNDTCIELISKNIKVKVFAKDLTVISSSTCRIPFNPLPNDSKCKSLDLDIHLDKCSVADIPSKFLGQ